MRRLVLIAVVLVFVVPTLAQDPPIPADTEIVTLRSGLKYSVLKAGGDGPKPKRGEKVQVHYTGWLTNGKVFDSSRKSHKPAEFNVGSLISGWNEALTMMTPGARWKLTIPPELGYGSRSMPGIPANSTLIFDVELVQVFSLPEFHKADPAKQKTTQSGIRYELLKTGAGEVPGEGDALELKFAFWNPQGRLMECTEQKGVTIKGTAASMGYAFLREMAPQLRKGDRMRLEVPSKLFGKQVPYTTVWELELVGVRKPLPIPEFTKLDADKTEQKPSGLKVQRIKEGEGSSPGPTDTVTVHYAGWFTDGKLFDASYGKGEPTTFPLRGVIRGWQEGLRLMKPGAVYLFEIPPGIAYGARGRSGIPGNSTLIFRIELLKVGE